MRVPQGQPVTVAIEVRDEPQPPETVGELVTPDSIALDLLGPLGLPLISATPNEESTGVYTSALDTEIALVGGYVGRWLTTGPGAGVKTFRLDVYDPFGAVPLGLSDAKKYLGIAEANTVHDEEIEGFIRALTPTIEFFAGPVEPRTVRRTVVGGWQIVLPTPLLDLISLSSGGTAISVADLNVDTETGIVEYANGFGGFPRGPMVATVLVGRRVVEEAITHASKVILDHLWETQRGPASTSSIRTRARSAETTIVPGLGYAVPNRAIELLKPLSTRTGLS